MKNLISISMFVAILLTLVLGCQREDIEPSSYVFSPVVIAPILVTPEIKLKSKFNYDSLSRESFIQKIDSLEARADTTFYLVEVTDNTPVNWSGLDYLAQEEEEEYPDSVFFGCPWKIMPVRYHILADLFDSIKLELPSFQLNMLISFNVVQLDVDALEFLEPSGPYLDWKTIHSKSASILDSDDPLGLKDPKYIAFTNSSQNGLVLSPQDSFACTFGGKTYMVPEDKLNDLLSYEPIRSDFNKEIQELKVMNTIGMILGAMGGISGAIVLLFHFFRKKTKDE